MRQISTTVELNDIGRITSAPSCRIHSCVNRPNSAPLDSVFQNMDQRDSFMSRDVGRRYLSRSSDDNEKPMRRSTSGAPFQENSTLIKNPTANNNINEPTALSPAMNQTRSLSSVINPQASALQTTTNPNSIKVLITTKIQISNAVKKAIAGSLLVIVVSVASAGATQFTKLALSDQHFYAPYFLAWFFTSWAIACYPLYCALASVFRCLKKDTPKMSKNLFREAKTLYGPNGPTAANSVLTKNLLFMSLWVVTNYAYCQALGYLSPAETNALFVSHPAFIYLVSWIYFHDAFISIRIISVLLSIVGVVLMAHATGIGTTSFIGVVSAVVSSSMAAIFKLFFKSMFGEPMLNQVALFFTMFGLSNLVFNWPLTFILYITNAEKIVWTSAPWKYICAAGALGLTWQFLSNLGTSSQYSVFVSIGLFCSLPLNAVVDIVLTKTIMGTFQIMGSVCIFVSCALLLLPADFTNRLPGHLMKADV